MIQMHFKYMLLPVQTILVDKIFRMRANGGLIYLSWSMTSAVDESI